MPGKHVLFRTTGSRKTGWGHLVRCMALAEGMRRAGWRPSFLLEGSDSNAARLVASGFPLVKKGGIPPDWTVFDSYALGSRERRSVRDAGSRLLCIDDQARGTFDADVVVNPNDGFRPREYRCAGKVRLLLGARYALLRRPFRNRPRSKKTASRARRILLAFGGTDPKRMTPRAESAMPRGAQVRVLRGASAAQAARLMDWADMAVSAAGSTCWELASRGVPLLTVILAKNQERVAAAVARRGAGVSLGWYDKLGSRRLRESVEGLAEDSRRRERMSRRGRALVDGRGVDRVVEVIRCWRG